MSNILVIGDSSYIGNAFLSHLRDHTDHRAEGMSLRDPAWESRSFVGFDAVFFAVGLTHVKETAENAAQFFAVNRDMALACARKARTEGVRQFIYMSSMSVYGMYQGVITPQTPPHPITNYGRSKLEAEEDLRLLENENFKICILRPPMVYGKNCKGNYRSLVRLVRKMPVFPRIQNSRSVLSIENLCGFLTLAVERELFGLYFPQNRERICTTDMACWIAEGLGKRLLLSRTAAAATRCLMPFSRMARKAFCSLTYEDTETMDYAYCSVSSREAVLRSLR